MVKQVFLLDKSFKSILLYYKEIGSIHKIIKTGQRNCQYFSEKLSGQFGEIIKTIC
jgi:hypothetical protein